MKTKNNSKVSKIIISIAMVLIINAIFMNPVKAETKKVTVNEIITAGQSWIKTGSDQAGDYNNPNAFVDDLMPIGQILVGVAIGTLTIVSVVMAIRWITATPDKQAKLKQQLIGLVVATFVIFGAVGIWTFIRNIMSQTGL